MDEATLRRLALELLDSPRAEIPPAERGGVADAITAALAVPEGAARAALIDALSAHPVTRRWMREHGATEDEVRGSLAGLSTTPVGLYYVCPKEDEDTILLSVPAQPPRCTIHGLPMILEQD
jgi:hypothetical protein